MLWFLFHTGTHSSWLSRHREERLVCQRRVVRLGRRSRCGKNIIFYESAQKPQRYVLGRYRGASVVSALSSLFLCSSPIDLLYSMCLLVLTVFSLLCLLFRAQKKLPLPLLLRLVALLAKITTMIPTLIPLMFLPIGGITQQNATLKWALKLQSIFLW